MMNLLDNRNITCVEYYLLNKLNPIIDIRKLYYKSYVSAYKIYLDLLDNDTTFYNYEGIERIQNILIENKMLTYKVTNEYKEEDFKNKTLVNLLLVNKNFFNNKKKVTFRNDHYIHVTKQNNKLMMISSYPMSIEEIDINTLNTFFDNKCLVYKIIRKDNLTFKKVKEEFIKQLNKVKHFSLPEIYDLNRFQSLIQLLKITRLRLYDLCNYLIVSDSLLNLINEASRYYENVFFKISMMIIKNKIHSTILKEIIFKINRYEYEIYKKLKEEFVDE